MVPVQDEKADRVTSGPKITIPIPTKKMTGRVGFEASEDGWTDFSRSCSLSLRYQPPKLGG
jgi:hypothetical protein